MSTSAVLKSSLLGGHPARDAARRARVSRRYAFQFARKHNLPTNPPVPPGSRTEYELLLSLHSEPRGVTRERFRLSEAALKSIERRIRRRK